MSRYSFRVVQGSELESVIDSAMSNNNAPVTRKRFVDEGFDPQIIVTMFKLGECADNFVVGRKGVSYTEVVPSTTIIHEADDVHVDSPTREPSNIPSILWFKSLFVNKFAI